MTSNYICKSCTRAIQLRLRSLRDARQLSGPLSASISTSAIPSNAKGPRHARNVENNYPSQFERSVEDDFLERLLAGRDSSSVEGLYSRAQSQGRPSVDTRSISQPQRRVTANNVKAVAESAGDLDAAGSNRRASRDKLTDGKHLTEKSDMDGLIRRRSIESSPLIYRPYSQRAHLNSNPKFAAAAVDGVRYVKSGIRLHTETQDGGSPKHIARDLSTDSAVSTESDLSDIFPQQRLAQGGSSHANGTASREQELRRQAVRLVTNPKLSAQQSWDNYQRFFGQIDADNAFLRGVQSNVFYKVTHGWCEDPQNTIKPTHALGSVPFMVRQAHIRNAVVWTILSYLTKAYGSDKGLADENHRRLLFELVKVWNAAVHRRTASRPESQHSGGSTTLQARWRALTSIWLKWRQTELVSSSFQERFRFFFDPLAATPNHTEKHLDTAILLTFVMVHQYETSPNLMSSQRLDQPEFLEFISSLMSYSDVVERLPDHKSALQAKLMNGTEHAETLVNEIKDHADRSLDIFAEARAASSSRTLEGTFQSEPEKQHALVEMFSKRLQRIIKTKQNKKLDPLYKDAERAFQNFSHGTAALPASLYSQFLTAYMTFRRPNEAVEIWNTMVRSDIDISVAMWTAMLKGCGISRQPIRLEEIWQRMLAAGMRPDVQAWATRIDGLARCRRINQALAAFQEMAGNWTGALPQDVQTSSSKDLSKYGDIGDIPKPNSHCVNTLVAHLTKFRDDEKLAQLFSWARVLGIEADAYTLNPIFALALEDEDADLAGRVLKQMHDNGIAPDMASFSLFISWFFRKNTSFGEKDEKSDRLLTVSRVFDLIHEAGFGVNSHTFATLIATLLQDTGRDGSTQDKEADGSLPAAYAVLDYMVEHSIPVVEQIYTTLISYHLNYQAEPDITAVDSLWTRARSELGAGLALDAMFYDRLIEGFSRMNLMGKAELALSQAARAGIAPGWVAMRHIVLALLRAGDSERAAEIVEQVRRQEGQAKDALRSRLGMREFWAMCEQEGLGGQFLPIEEAPPLRGSMGLS